MKICKNWTLQVRGELTMVSFQSHKDGKRNSIFDTKETVNLGNLHYNAKLIAETLARLMYGFNESEVLITHVSIFGFSFEFWA